MKNLDLRQFAEVMVALLAQKGIACRLGENNGRIGIIYEEAGIKASTDVTLLWQKYGADYDVTELADVLYKAITSEVQKKKAEMPNPMPEPQVQPQIPRPQMKTQPGRVTQQPMPDDMGGKMQIKCFNGIPGQNGAPLFEGSFDSPEEAKAAIAGFMKDVLNADDASVTEFMKEFDASTRDAEAPKQHVKKPEPGDTARLAKNIFNMRDDEANDFLANLLKADLERKSVCHKPAPAGEPCQSTFKYTKKDVDVMEAEEAARRLIKNLFGVDLPKDMHSTAYNMAADDKTGDKTDACRSCGKDCTCGSYPKLSKQPPKQPKQNFDLFRELFAQPAKPSADPSELLESVYPAFITDEMLDGYDIEKVLHLPVFGMHLVYYVDDALAHKYDGLILSDKFPFLSLKAFEIFKVTEDEINNAALANIKEKVRLEKTSFVERNAFLITSDAPGIVSCASILCDGLLYNTATALGHDKVFVLELQPNEVIVLGADEPIGELIGGTLDYTLKNVDKTVGKLLSTTVFCYNKRVNTLYPCSFNN